MSVEAMTALGRLIADRSRAKMLEVLMSGTAHTAGELARVAGIAPSTASEHLAQLVDGGLVVDERHGRNRYFRIAGADIASLLEASLTAAEPPTDRRVPHDLRYARTCYDHLAGELGVSIFDSLLRDDHLILEDGIPRLTPGGHDHLARLEIDPSSVSGYRRQPARLCLDWTHRRYHLGGAIAARMLDRMLTDGWFVRRRTPRALRLTSRGEAKLVEHFGLQLGR